MDPNLNRLAMVAAAERPHRLREAERERRLAEAEAGNPAPHRALALRLRLRLGAALGGRRRGEAATRPLAGSVAVVEAGRSAS